MSVGTKEITTEKQPSIFGTLSSDSFKKQLSLALPRHMTPDRFARIAITALRKTPKLQQCTPESLLSCLMSLSQYGLEPDGRRAHLIPFENRKQGIVECTLILDYKGLAELALRSGLVSTLHADVVQEGDIFDYSMGKISRHVPWFLRRDSSKPDEAGPVYAVYAMCENRDGTTKCEVLSLAEVNGIRQRSKSANSGPWQTDWSEMAKKTCFRRLSKWLVLSPEFRDAVTDDEDRDVIETTAKVTRTDNVKLSDLVDANEQEHVEQKPDNFGSIVEYFAGTSIKHSTDCPEEHGYSEWMMPNGKILVVATTDRLPKSHDESVEIVDCNDADALQQVKNIVEHCSKHRG
jgi:recombination protein RecT